MPRHDPSRAFATRVRPHWRACLPVVLALAATGAPLAASAAALRVDYTITLAGLTLGRADLSGAVDDERYSLRMNAQLTGVAGLVTGSGRGGATSRGVFQGTKVVSNGFSASGQSGGTARTAQLGIENGTVAEIRIEPPFEYREDRVPLTEASKRGIVDPLSGILGVSTGRDRPDGAALCNRTVPVFDGTQRFDVQLSFAETKRVEKPGFSGEVVVCNARYTPLAGHRPERPAVKFMRDNREMSVWLAPVAGTRVFVPLRISVQTLYGLSVVEADKWSTGAAATR